MFLAAFLSPPLGVKRGRMFGRDQSLSASLSQPAPSQTHEADCSNAQQRNRGRFQWSLRTLFVVMTVVGCWLGYYANWIRQRHEALKRNEESRAIFAQVGGLSPTGTFPWTLRLLGEEPLEFIALKIEREVDLKPSLSRIQVLFPESWVQPYLWNEDEWQKRAKAARAN